MSVPPGLYYIQSVSDQYQFVGTGPIPPVWPPFPSPLRHVPGQAKDTFELAPLGNNKYSLKHKVLALFVGYEDDMVKLIPMGGKPQPWDLETLGPGMCCFKHPESGQCWTSVDDDEYGPIKLQPGTGAPNQQWRLILLERD